MFGFAGEAIHKTRVCSFQVSCSAHPRIWLSWRYYFRQRSFLNDVMKRIVFASSLTITTRLSISSSDKTMWYVNRVYFHLFAEALQKRGRFICTSLNYSSVYSVLNKGVFSHTNYFACFGFFSQLLHALVLFFSKQPLLWYDAFYSLTEDERVGGEKLWDKPCCRAWN